MELRRGAALSTINFMFQDAFKQNCAPSRTNFPTLNLCKALNTVCHRRVVEIAPVISLFRSQVCWLSIRLIGRQASTVE